MAHVLGRSRRSGLRAGLEGGTLRRGFLPRQRMPFRGSSVGIQTGLPTASAGTDASGLSWFRRRHLSEAQAGTDAVVFSVQLGSGHVQISLPVVSVSAQAGGGIGVLRDIPLATASSSVQTFQVSLAGGIQVTMVVASASTNATALTVNLGGVFVTLPVADARAQVPADSLSWVLRRLLQPASATASARHIVVPGDGEPPIIDVSGDVTDITDVS